MSHRLHPDLPRRSSPVLRAALRRTGLVTAAVATACALGLPAAASAKVGTITDPAGDGKTPGQDITQLVVDYRASGTLIVTVTTAGPIDGANNDALLTVGLLKGSDCFGGTSGIAYATLANQDDPLAYGLPKGAKNYSKAVVGSQTIVGNVLTVTYSGKRIKNLKPKCYTAKFTDPSTGDSSGKKYDTLALQSFRQD